MEIGARAMLSGLKLGNRDLSNQKWTDMYATMQGSAGHIGGPGQ
jgi:hypothetical protein